MAISVMEIMKKAKVSELLILEDAVKEELKNRGYYNNINCFDLR